MIKMVYTEAKAKRENRCNTKPFYLYVTNCHTSTEEADIENHFPVNFLVVDEANAFKTK